LFLAQSIECAQCHNHPQAHLRHRVDGTTVLIGTYETMAQVWHYTRSFVAGRESWSDETHRGTQRDTDGLNGATCVTYRRRPNREGLLAQRQRQFLEFVQIVA
jgi:hypothetical protein